MKTSVIAVAASLATAVYAQGRGGTADTPEDNAINCAKFCFNQYNVDVNTGCQGDEDYGCICQNTNFLASLDPCLIQACNGSQFPTINAYFKEFCGQQNVELNIDVAPTTEVDLSSIPVIRDIQCAATCLGNIVAATDCDATDASCLCKNVLFVYGVGPCVWNSCELDDFSAIDNGLEQYCRAAGETVTITVTSAQSKIPVSTFTETAAAKTEEPSAGETTGAARTSGGGAGGAARTTGASGPSRTGSGNATVTSGTSSPTPNDAPRMAVAISGFFAAAIAFAAALL
ncbi:hypothetical protein TWF696_005548 [Orbilia brochopaga]|uniref:CFEM domain-containing protein n=1 Tax=Orbilia brochopaga TaxID=3140254 RepID=A0AAV9V461_9PEZI